MTTLVGYVRVARSEEPYQDQVDALDAAGCERIFVDVAGGRRAPRPGLQDALDYLRENDELLVVSLDRLGPGAADVVRILNGLEARGIAFRAIRDGLEAGTAAGRGLFAATLALATVEATTEAERHRKRSADRSAGSAPEGAPEAAPATPAAPALPSLPKGITRRKLQIAVEERSKGRDTAEIARVLDVSERVVTRALAWAESGRQGGMLR
ncbi:recombinase family protein [Clavibacter michiganensis]|uniref:DNA-invertase/recombinase n=5 Tax=Clavibacter michiganensis TaxID=28447 RepID=A5CSR0_CLAM3|nr:recombinase family protein [Clavibacter michiganensis]MBF4638863.1 recombinase family protein [Clavibacter michiganensis subsp. michiganensis]MBW8027729.1 recombinase family protein [Clavibacter michiganensis subsp. michiganensis]MDO4018778.1 recombinase family protein [Clavibacter michiganensis]MDO4025887.1 recombinase family protein [Clavibacter michiganensis]MDO4028785.1 recombinase family protein [Clavibacter michiganensis]